MATPEQTPTIFVAFGATGDLMQRKVIPALYYLHTRGRLPEKFCIMGFSRRDWSDDDFRSYIRDVMEKRLGTEFSDASLNVFLDLFRFQKGEFTDEDSYKALAKAFKQCDSEWNCSTNKLFYLAVAPEHYKTILKNLADSGLTGPKRKGAISALLRGDWAKGVGETVVSPWRNAGRSPLRTEGSQSGSPQDSAQGWTHIIVEKPFGMSLGTAKEIDELVGELFEEQQIYRIDHYLAKEMLQNILTFRFSNNLFEIPWGNGLIEKITIRILERIGVENRGVFYDGVGALRDVGQNHVLQMLALVTMDHPAEYRATAIQTKRAAALEKLRVIEENDAKRFTYRAQYNGYRGIEGVAPDSETETYFKIRAELDDPKWKGVPIILESGKRMGEPLKEIIVTFKHPAPCLCPPGGNHHKNEIIFRMEPREEILIEFWSKKPGFTFETERRELRYMVRDQSEHVPYVEEYAKLLLDCVEGDRTLFISTDEIRAMWRFTDPIEEAWRKGAVPLSMYEPDTREASEASRAIET